MKFSEEPGFIWPFGRMRALLADVFYHSRAEALRKINITTDLNFMWQWKVENMVMLLGYIQKCQKSYVCCWGMGVCCLAQRWAGDLCPHIVCPGDCPLNLVPQELCPAVSLLCSQF